MSPTGSDLAKDFKLTAYLTQKATGSGTAFRKAPWPPLCLLCGSLAAFSPSTAGLGNAWLRDVPARESTTWLTYGELAKPHSPLGRITVPRATSERLARIRANLSLNVAELARILRVERPTIYAWMRDEIASLRTENRQRLDRLDFLARRWGALSTFPVGGLIRATNDAGDSLLSLLERERFSDALRILEALPEKVADAARPRVPTVRESLQRHGLEIKIKRTSGEVDRISQ
jgi:transcriptional regulator with XRE-family HTH domain